MIPIYFAPLQGYTEDAYRRIHHRLVGGVESYYTPFVRWEHGGVRSKDMRDIRPEFNVDVPVVPQVIAGSAKELRALLDVIIPLGYKHVDINMGCPFPLQIRHGKGAGILPHSDKVAEICSVIEDSKDVEFSVKMRLGLNDKDDWKEVLPILNDTNLKHITIHPRIASQQYKGTVDMESFEAFLSACKHHVIYNGDVLDVQQIIDLEESFPIAGVMIGRGLLSRPTLAKEYASGNMVDDASLVRLIKDMHSQYFEHMTSVIPSEAQQLAKLKTFWDYMENTIGRKSWKRIVKAGNMKNYLAAINDL